MKIEGARYGRASAVEAWPKRDSKIVVEHLTDTRHLEMEMDGTDVVVVPRDVWEEILEKLGVDDA